MEQMTATATAVANGTSLRQTLAAAAGLQQQGSGFAALLSQLVGDDDALMALLGQVTQQQNEQQGGKNGGMLAAQLLLALAAASPQLTVDANVAQQILQQGGNAQTISDALAGLPVMNGNTAAVQTADTQQTGQEAPADQAELSAFYQVLSAAWQQTQTDTQTGGGSAGEGLFSQQALREARKLLDEQGKQTVERPDVEQLQAAVDAKQFLPATAPAETFAQSAQVQDIAEQLRTGILNNVANGKSEFVVKLKPEGLGEITVHLSDDKSKISLSIMVADPQTAKLISNEVATLQNALRPLQAEVHQIITGDGTNLAYAAQNSLSQQNQQYQQGQHAGRQATFGAQNAESDEFVDTVESILNQDGELDTYI